MAAGSRPFPPGVPACVSSSCMFPSWGSPLIPCVSLQAKAVGRRAPPAALPQKAVPVATQVKSEGRKDDSQSSEESTDSDEEEAAPAASAPAQVGSPGRRGGAWPVHLLSRVMWVLVGREARRSCIPEQMWPVNQGVLSSLPLRSLHRPNQLWESRQRLPRGKAPPPRPQSPLCW